MTLSQGPLVTRLTGIAQGPGLQKGRQAGWTNGFSPGGVLAELLSFYVSVYPSVRPAPLSWAPLRPVAALSGRSAGHTVTGVIQLRRMNCDGPRGAVPLGIWPLRMVLRKLSTDPRGRAVTSLTFQQDAAVKPTPNLELEDRKRAS